MFNIQLKNYSSDEVGAVSLDVEVMHEDKNLFHCTFEAIIMPCFEDGLYMKDAEFDGLNKFTLIANSLFSPEQLKKFTQSPFSSYPQENSNDPLEILMYQLEQFAHSIYKRMAYKVHIADKPQFETTQD